MKSTFFLQMEILSHLEVNDSSKVIQLVPRFLSFLLSFLLILPSFFSHQHSVPPQSPPADYFLDLPLLYEISCASNYEIVGLSQLVTLPH